MNERSSTPVHKSQLSQTITLRFALVLWGLLEGVFENRSSVGGHKPDCRFKVSLRV